METKATLFRVMCYAVGVVLTALVVLFFTFTIIPSAYKSFGFNRSGEIATQAGKVVMDKALIAKACDRHEKACIDNVLLVSGDLDGGTISAIKQLIADVGVDTVCFNSRGGDKSTAIDIGKFIKRNKLNTCMAEKYLTAKGDTITQRLCASACPFVLAMGRKRTALGNDLRIGIHSSGTNLDFGLFMLRVNALDFVALHGYEAMLKQSNVVGSRAHVKMLHDSLSTPFDGMRFLSTDEQKQYALFTDNH
ncbi:hypothetical protein [Pseudomonas sp.]|uniref:hypothetical protein n=1 Tax=Pseudomonas sp. TaxID=306 RepID=UPI0027BA7C2A|nr:hypothetical protein [Pseudomonas sp.]